MELGINESSSVETASGKFDGTADGKLGLMVRSGLSVRFDDLLYFDFFEYFFPFFGLFFFLEFFVWMEFFELFVAFAGADVVND